MLDVILTSARLQFISGRVGAELSPDAVIAELNTLSSVCFADPEDHGYDDPMRAFRVYLTSPTLVLADFDKQNAGAMLIQHKPGEAYLTKQYFPGFYKPPRENSVSLELNWILGKNI